KNWPIKVSFYPRPRTGGDVRDKRTGRALEAFLSAPPHGGRRRWSTTPTTRSRFYPRPRTGGDHSSFIMPACSGSFYPRPRTGGDDDGLRPRPPGHVSIRAPARGATTAPS